MFSVLSKKHKKLFSLRKFHFSGKYENFLLGAK